MAKDTKERILAAALEQFSQNGYAGTNIRELTASLGVVKSAMYKHFESKEDIWNTLLDEMIVYYDEHFGSPDHLPLVPDSKDSHDALSRRFSMRYCSFCRNSGEPLYKNRISRLKEGIGNDSCADTERIKE